MDRKAWVCFGLSVYALILRIGALWHHELWEDELYQFHRMNEPKPFWLHQTYGDHTAFPGGYLVDYPFIVMFGMNKWGLAVPHLVATLAGLFVFYKLCRMYLATSGACLIAFLVVAMNATLIVHALEFRPYAVLPTLALGSLFFAEIVARRIGQLTTLQKCLIILFYAFTAIYHAYSVLIVALPIGYALAMQWRREARFPSAAVRFFAAVFVLALPLWAWYASFNAFGTRNTPGVSISPTFQYIPDPSSDLAGFAKAVAGNLMGSKILYVLFAGIAGVFVARGQRVAQLLFLFLLILLPIGLILLSDIRCQYWFLQRQFVWVIPFFALWLAWCWDVVFLRVSKRPRTPDLSGG